MSGECDECGEHCLDCPCNSTEDIRPLCRRQENDPHNKENKVKKYDNEWNIEAVDGADHNFNPQPCRVDINGETYYMPEHYAGIAHALLLIVDAINDK